MDEMHSKQPTGAKLEAEHRPQTSTPLRRVAPVVMATLLVGGLIARSHLSQAADHLDPPGRVDPMKVAAGVTADREADIADVFAWHSAPGAANQSLFLAMTFSGPNAPADFTKLKCDKDVLYTINVDNNNDGKADVSISARFAKDDKDNCFVKFEGIPNIAATVVRTEVVTELGGVKYFSGLRDDAFFFDLQGFRETFMTGKIAMTSDRDFFKGKNTPVIALELPAATVAGGNTKLRVWATTARHP
jgi:Domain of unknown function (DUF4331)